MLSVVTGGTGHVGTNLVGALLAAGHDVRVLAPDASHSRPDLDVERVDADVRDPQALLDAFACADVVFHLAARISVVQWDRELVAATNVDGTRNVVHAAAKAGVGRLVHFSSVHAMDESGSIGDDTPVDVAAARSPYPRSKALGELEAVRARDLGVPTVVLRPTGVLGPADPEPSRTGRFLLHACRGRFPLVPRGGFDWVDVRDVAAAAVRAAADTTPEGCYVVAGCRGTILELATWAAETVGARPPLGELPLGLLQPVGRAFDVVGRVRRTEPMMTSDVIRPLGEHHVLRTGRAAAVLGHRPRPLAESVVDTCRWFDEHGMLGRSFQRRLPRAMARPNTESRTALE